jgi:SAM-dependent methyltransferase
MSDGRIRVEEVTTCALCETQGTSLYERLSDRLFGTPGEWGFLRCPQCGLVWLSPRPVPEELGKVYSNYSTHTPEGRRSRLALWRQKVETALYASTPGYGNLIEGWGWKLLGRVLSKVPLLTDVGRLGTMCLEGDQKGMLIDVGCGAGEFLARMRTAGWQVLGIEPDPSAAKHAEERFGLPVIVGALPDVGLRDATFDAVALHHVLEHAPDPLRLLMECRRVLKPGGRLVVATPNVDSMGHRQFEASWRGLEPPRHYYLFSMATLREFVSRCGITISLLRTSSRSASWIWAVSAAQKNDEAARTAWKIKLQGLAFRRREEAARRISEGVGEELILVGVRAESN